MVLSSVGFPLVLNYFLQSFGAEDFEFIAVSAKLHQRCPDVEVLIFSRFIWVVRHVKSKMRQEIDGILDLENFGLLLLVIAVSSFIWDSKFIFWEYSLVVVSQIEEGLLVGSDALSVVGMISGPSIKIKSDREDITI